MDHHDAHDLIGCQDVAWDVVGAAVELPGRSLLVLRRVTLDGAPMDDAERHREAAGEGLESGKHSASLQRGSPGVLHGNRTYILQDDNGQIIETHSVSAGLDYPGVGPEHAWLKDTGRAEYVGVTDTEALEAFHVLERVRVLHRVLVVAFGHDDQRLDAAELALHRVVGLVVRRIEPQQRRRGVGIADGRAASALAARSGSRRDDHRRVAAILAGIGQQIQECITDGRAISPDARQRLGHLHLLRAG